MISSEFCAMFSYTIRYSTQQRDPISYPCHTTPPSSPSSTQTHQTPHHSNCPNSAHSYPVNSSFVFPSTPSMDRSRISGFWKSLGRANTR